MASAGLPLASMSVGGSGRVFDDRDGSKDCMIRMAEVWRKDRFCDITFDVEGEKIAAHRIILAARREYFNALLQPSMREGSQSIIELKEVKPEYVRLLINYIYSSRITITDENIEDVLWTANYLGLEGACRACCTFIVDSLTIDNASRALDIAIAIYQLELQKNVKEYILKHFGQITNRDEYLEWPTDLFESFLKEEDELTMRNDDGKVLPSREVEELELAKRILNYVRHDQTRRLSFLPRALSHVRPGLLGEKQICELKIQVDGIGGANIFMEVLDNISKDVVPRKTSAFTISSEPTYDDNIDYSYYYYMC